MTRVESAKCFMFICLGLLAFTGVIQLVTSNAIAQSPDPTEVASAYWSESSGAHVAVMANGDVYRSSNYLMDSWLYVSNVFGSAGVVSSSESTLGDIKEQYK